MTSIASFVLECAASGRWQRGLLALQSNATSSNAELRHASVALAVVSAPHDWRAALALLQPQDASRETALVCGLVASFPRSPHLTASQGTCCVRSLLDDASSSPSHSASPAPAQDDGDDTQATHARSLILLQALHWCAHSAAEVLCRAYGPQDTAGASARRASARERHAAFTAQWEKLQALRGAAEDVYAHFPFHHALTAPRVTSARTPPASLAAPRDRQSREQSHLHAHRAATARTALAQREQRAVLAALRGRIHSAVIPSVLNVKPSGPVDQVSLTILARDELRYPAATDLGVLLEVATRASPHRTSLPSGGGEGPAPRPPSPARRSSRPPPPPTAPPVAVAWQLALGLTHACPTLTPELFPLYMRCVGLRAPHLWATALRQAERYWSCYTPTADASTAIPDHGAHVGDSSPDGTTRGTSPQPLRRPSLQEACLALWLLSRGSWKAAVEFYAATHPTAAHTSQSPASVESQWCTFAEDCLSRTAAPLTAFLHLFPSRDGVSGKRPHVRLLAPTRRHVARALASGNRLEEIQMSAVARRWVAGGHWQELLWLYERLPTEEFQRRAVRCLVSHLHTRSGTEPPTRAPSKTPPPRTASAIVEVLAKASGSQGRRQRGRVPPPGTHVTWLLIGASRSPSEALRVFRRCIQLGTTCQPQLLSGLMDMQVRRKDLEEVLRHYPDAVNDGVRRRAAEEFGIHLTRG